MFTQQPLLQVFAKILSIFDIMSLSSVSKEFRTTILNNQNLGVLITNNVMKNVDQLYPLKESFINKENGRLCSKPDPKDMGSFTLAEPLLNRIIVGASIQSWSQEMKECICWLSISVLHRYPTWVYQTMFSPLYPNYRNASDAFRKAIDHISSSIQNRLTTRIQPILFKTKTKKGQYKPLNKEQIKYNSLLDDFQWIRKAVFPPVQYKKSLKNIFCLLNQNQSIQTGSDVHLKIMIAPPKSNPDALVVFSSGEQMTIPRLCIKLAKASNRTFRRIRQCDEDDLDSDIYAEETIVQITDGSKEETNGIVCAIFSDGQVINTTLFAKYESFLEEFNRDIWTNSGIIGKICNACIFCQKPLSRNESLENGFGSVCEKKWALHLYRARHNRAVIDYEPNTAVKSAFGSDSNLLTLFKPLDRQEPPRKKRRITF